MVDRSLPLLLSSQYLSVFLVCFCNLGECECMVVSWGSWLLHSFNDIIRAVAIEAAGIFSVSGEIFYYFLQLFIFFPCLHAFFQSVQHDLFEYTLVALEVVLIEAEFLLKVLAIFYKMVSEFKRLLRENGVFFSEMHRAGLCANELLIFSDKLADHTG